LVDVIVGHDLASGLLGVVDTSVQQIVNTSDVREGVARPGGWDLSIALQFFPFQILWLQINDNKHPWHDVSPNSVPRTKHKISLSWVRSAQAE
jgi:hypothetical protein